MKKLAGDGSVHRRVWFAQPYAAGFILAQIIGKEILNESYSQGGRIWSGRLVVDVFDFDRDFYHAGLHRFPEFDPKRSGGNGFEIWKRLVRKVRSIDNIFGFPEKGDDTTIEWDMSDWALERFQYAWLGAILRAMVDGLSGFVSPSEEITVENQYDGMLEFVLQRFVNNDIFSPTEKMKVSYGFLNM